MNTQRTLKTFFAQHKAITQAVLFTLFSMVAFGAQLLIQFLGDLAMKSVTRVVAIWPFEAQPLGTFLSFLLANAAAKVISFVMNRKKTFKANNNRIFSAVAYTIMVVVLIIVETVIGTPLGNSLFRLFNGYVSLEGCMTISMILYSTCDFVIVFLMDKFVIMRHKEEKSEEEEVTPDDASTAEYDRNQANGRADEASQAAADKCGVEEN